MTHLRLVIGPSEEKVSPTDYFAAFSFTPSLQPPLTAHMPTPFTEHPAYSETGFSRA